MTRDSEAGAVIVTTLAIAALLIGLFEGGRQAVRMIDTAGSHYSGIVEASADQPDWDKVEKGHLRYAQKAMAHGVLAGRAVVGGAGSPSQWYDLPSNIDTVASAAHEVWESYSSDAPAQASTADDGDEGDDSDAAASESDEQWVCEDGAEWGCDIEVRPGDDDTDERSASPTADGVYTFNPGPFIRSLPAAVSYVDGQITVDSESGMPVQGQVTMEYVPDTGGGVQTDTFEFWSEEPPVLDSADGSWDVSLYLQRTSTEPYLFSATIRAGSLTFDYAPFGLDLSFTRR